MVDFSTLDLGLLDFSTSARSRIERSRIRRGELLSYATTALLLLLVELLPPLRPMKPIFEWVPSQKACGGGAAAAEGDGLARALDDVALVVDERDLIHLVGREITGRCCDRDRDGHERERMGGGGRGTEVSGAARNVVEHAKGGPAVAWPRPARIRWP